MRLAIRFALFALCLREAVAQTPPDVAEILKKVGETYTAGKSYEFVFDVTSQDGSTSHVLIAFKAPKRYRMEGGVPLAETPGMDLRDARIICDGTTVWFALPKSNQYAAIAVKGLDANAPGDLGDVLPEAVDDFAMSQFRRAADLAPAARFLREESIHIKGAKIDCFVVTLIDEGAASTWWIDKASYRVRRADREDESNVFTEIKLNEPLPDALFRFTPPPGARKIELSH
jgi:outer membrane lipoprotein-sorting protein